MVQISINKWRPDPTADEPNRIYVEYSDLTGRHFRSLQEAKAVASADLETLEVVKRWALAKGLNQDPNFVNSGLIEGKTCQIDITTGNMVRWF